MVRFLVLTLLQPALACILLGDQVPAQVSPLEAVHIAEIVTGGVFDSVEPLTDGTEPRYQVLGQVNDTQLKVIIHRTHGRVLAVYELKHGAWKPRYQWPGVRVVAHRGGALLGPPENTLQAIEKAIEVGADLIEIDIRQTRDGHLVLMHDERVDRTTNGSGLVRDFNLEALRDLMIHHEGEEVIRVPTLDEALKVMKGRIDPDLDYKQGDLGALLQVVRAHDMVEACTLHGNWERCEKVAQLEPGLRIRPSAEFPLQVPTLARTLRPALINFDWHAVSEKGISLAHLHGTEAFVNCLGGADTVSAMKWAIEAGADYIQSDRPDRVIAHLKALGLYRLRPSSQARLGTPLRAPALKYPFR